MFIIFGLYNLKRKLSQIPFDCPNCKKETVHTLEEGRNWFNLFFIPLMPMGRLKLLLRCSTCNYELDHSTLSYKEDSRNGFLSRLLMKTKSHFRYILGWILMILMTEMLITLTLFKIEGEGNNNFSVLVFFMIIFIIGFLLQKNGSKLRETLKTLGNSDTKYLDDMAILSILHRKSVLS